MSHRASSTAPPNRILLWLLLIGPASVLPAEEPPQRVAGTLEIELPASAFPVCIYDEEGAQAFRASTAIEPPKGAARSETKAPRDGFVRVGVWDVTATDSSITRLKPMTLTYSIIPDGAVITGQPFAGDATSPSDLFAQFDSRFPGGRNAWKAAFASAFARWTELTGITFIEVGDDGASFPDSPGLLGARGDIRIGMHAIGAAGVAYNLFPARGDMVLDNEDMAFFILGNDGFRLLRNVLMHEIGHGIGLDHVAPLDRTKIMEPVVPTAFDGPQQDDVRGAQSQNGDGAEANNSIAGAEPLGALSLPVEGVPQPVGRENLAIEDAGEVDFFAFEFQGVGLLDVHVAPTGLPYFVAPVAGSQILIEAHAIHDLAFDLIAPDRVTLLARRNETGAGTDENIFQMELSPGPGVYYVRVYSVGSARDIQQYRLLIGLVPPPNKVVEWENYD